MKPGLGSANLGGGIAAQPQARTSGAIGRQPAIANVNSPQANAAAMPGQQPPLGSQNLQQPPLHSSGGLLNQPPNSRGGFQKPTISVQDDATAPAYRNSGNVARLALPSPRAGNVGPMSSPRSKNFSNRLHDFQNLHSLYSMSNTMHRIKGYDPRAQTLPYLVTIQGVRSLSLADTKFGKPVLGDAGQMIAPTQSLDARYSVEYHATFYSNQIELERGWKGFYGRTCPSKPHPLITPAANPTLLETNEEDFMFFHSSFVEPSSTLLIEVVVIKHDGPGGHNIEKASAGFAVLNIFDFPQQATAVLVQSGSPRMWGAVGTDLEQKNRAGKAVLTFEITKFTPFQDIRNLVPQNCLVNMNDIIPGLDADSSLFPKPRPTFSAPYINQRVPTLPKKTIYLHNLSLQSDSAFEAQFESFLREVVQVEMGGKQSGAVIIAQRAIHVGVNNCWHNLNKTERQIVLEEPNNRGLCQGTGSIILEDYIEHPLVALTFRIEFKAMLPIKPQPRQIYHTVAWQVQLPSLNDEGHIQNQNIDLVCNIGNQVSMMNDLVWGMNDATHNISRRNFKLRIMANISTDKTGRQQADVNVSNTAEDFFPQQPPVPKPTVNVGPTQKSPTGSSLYQPKSIPGPSPSSATRPGSGGFGNQRPASSSQKQPRDQYVHGRGLSGSSGSYQNMPPNNRYSPQGSRHGGSQGMRSSQNNYSNVQYHAQPNAMDPQYPQQDPYRQQTQYVQAGLDPKQQQEMNTRFDRLGNETANILTYLQRLEAERRDQIMQDQRTGQIDYNLQNQQQVQMIGNVFYNLLNHMGHDKNDPKIIELSRQVKDMMQTRRFDNLMGLKVPHLKSGVMNLLKVVDLSTEDQIELQKMGYGDLLRNPAAQVRSQDVQAEMIDLNRESMDQLKACTITFQFVVFKTSMHCNPKLLPRRLYFQLRFFTFPEVQTDTVGLVEPGVDRELQIVRPNGTYYMAKDRMINLGHGKFQKQKVDTLSEPDMLAVQFEIDPSVSKVADEHMKLARYMKEQLLTIEIYDADTRFHFATAKLPLYELLRQQSSHQVRSKEVEAAAPDSAEFRASIQIIMSNKGRQEREQLKEQTGETINFRETRGQQPSQQSGFNKKKYSKVVRSHPMDLNRVEQPNDPTQYIEHQQQSAGMAHSHAMTGASFIDQNVYDSVKKPIMGQLSNQQMKAVNENPDLRKKLRVDRVRKMVIGHSQNLGSVEDPSKPDWMKAKSIREIETIRESKKRDIINQVVGADPLGAYPTLSVMPGHLAFLEPLPLLNETNSTQSYTIRIMDPDEQILGIANPEMQLVQDGAELNHWVAQGKVSRPPSFDAITRRGDVQLRPKQHIDLLFKFLTKREVSLSPTAAATEHIIRPRKIRIVVLINDQVTKMTYDVQVVPSLPPIDHTFRFYEPEQSHYQVGLPPFIQINHPGLQIDVSNPDCRADIVKDTSIFTVAGRCGDAMTVQPMTLFIYSDGLKSSLVATVKVEVHSRPVIYTRAKINHQSMHTLTMPVRQARSVMIYSNKPQNVFRDETRASQPENLLPNSIHPIPIFCNFEKPEILLTPSLVNAVDVNSCELVYSWLLVVETVP